jgi:hypothetical protein
MTVLVAFFLFMIYIFYLMTFSGGTPVVYTKSIMPAKVVGDQVDVTVSLCRYSDKPFTSYVSFTNGIIFDVPPIIISGIGLGCQDVHKFFDIPTELPSGTYFLTVRNVFEINKLKTITAGYVTEKFDLTRHTDVLEDNDTI